MTVINIASQTPFTTKDGSTIRSILDRANALVKNQSLAIAAGIAVIFSMTPGLAFADGPPKWTPAEVPTFQLRARVTSCEGQQPQEKKFRFALADLNASTAGNAWSDWLAFGPKQIEDALKRYPNLLHKQYPVVDPLSIGGAVDPTLVEVETRLKEDGPVSSYSAELFGPKLSLLIWRDQDRQPHVGPAAEYNQRYWEAFKAVAIPEAERPKVFPIVDRFMGAGDDRRLWEEGISNLARAGFTALVVPPEPRFREMLLKAGLHRTASAIYNPPGYAFDFVARPDTLPAGWTGKLGSTTPEAIAQWAHDRIDPYLKAGFKPEDMATYGIADEPGWYYPMWINGLTDSPEGMQEFRDYLKAKGLTPPDVGAAKWEDVLPIGRSKAKDLPSRRLFYWTARFFPWASARHFASVTRAMEKAGYPNMPVYVNWNNFSGQLFHPGPQGNNKDKTNPDAATGFHDWLEFGRMRGATALATEDWFNDSLAWKWSLYCARLRCAAEKGGVQFIGLIVPRAAGSREDGIVQKVLTLVGSGGKGVQYFIFGPEYTFPINCYSENLKMLPQMVEAHRMIGKAEDLLWPGVRPRAQTAILAPRSAEMWDEKNVPIVKRTHADYMLELDNIYLALQHADIPADFVEEDDLSLKGLAPYKVLYLTEPNIPAEFQQGVLEWVQKGGTVVTVTGAGMADRYDDPCDILSRGLGIAEQPRERELIGNPSWAKESGTGSGTAGDFTAFGPRGKLTDVPAAGVLAKFADGAPAIIERTVGNGRVIYFTWMPGLSYFKPSRTTNDKLPTGFPTAIRSMITYPVQAARVVPPVTVNQAMIETPLLLSEKGAAVTLLNWTDQAQKEVKITVRIPFAVKSVESVKRGKLAFNQTEQGVTCALPLDAADIVLLRP